MLPKSANINVLSCQSGHTLVEYETFTAIGLHHVFNGYIFTQYIQSHIFHPYHIQSLTTFHHDQVNV